MVCIFYSIYTFFFYISDLVFTIENPFLTISRKLQNSKKYWVFFVSVNGIPTILTTPQCSIQCSTSTPYPCKELQQPFSHAVWGSSGNNCCYWIIASFRLTVLVWLVCHTQIFTCRYRAEAALINYWWAYKMPL